MSSPMIRGFAHVATTLATVALVAFVALSGVLAGGNNGTIKIHEYQTSEMTPNNDPKVCSFNVEGFGFDDGQVGWIRFEVQGGDAPHGSDPSINEKVTADTDGSFSSVYHNLQRGHYKATLYDASGNEKAKSKVFKVTCGSPEDGGGEGGGIG